MNIQNILQLPLEQKCEQLTHYTDNCMLSTLESVFPLIISDIFGTDQPLFNGWNLCKITHDIKSREFACAFNFLLPNGTIFKIIYTLLKDFYIKYRFPLEYLPLAIQKSIKEGTMSQFYLDKLCIDPKTQKILYLYLNPFEFYMFSFVKYLCDNGKFEENLEIQLNVDTLYQRLLAVYCDKFLPVVNNLPIEPNVYYTHSVSPIVITPKKKSSLFKPGVLSPNSSFQSTSPPHHSFSGGGGGGGVSSPNVGEVWRSELLVHLFVDFWLQHDESLDLVFPRPFQQSPFSPLYRNVPNSDQNALWTVPVFPSGYQVRCIRYVIKHFHQFAREQLQDSSSLGELRRTVLPMTQGQIYSFLRHHIAHWPLDSSFKLIQETWFSFIQPWRYASASTLPPDTEDDLSPPSVDSAWAHFIADNLAAYTSLLQLVLDRVLRLDLNNLFNAHMVFRVAKVYSVPNLAHLLKEIEADLYNDKLNNKFGGPSARQSVLRLDASERMFSHETTKKVSLLVTRIHQAIAHCTLELRSPPAPSLSLWKTIQAEIHELLYGYSCRPPKCDKNSRTNLTHTIRYLSQAAQWFCTIFNIPQPQTSAPTFNSTYDESTQCNLDHTLDNTLVTGPPRLNVTNGSEEEADSMFLPESSLTLKSMQERVRRMKYDGDPDLLPPGSGEIRWLVKLFYYLSCQINIAFYDQIQDIYSRESGLPSLILHATLLPPCVVYQYRLHSWAFIPAPKVPVQLPARLSLRSFASWATILKLGFHAILLCAVFGCHYTLGIAMVLLLWFLTALLKYELKRVCSGLFGN